MGFFDRFKTKNKFSKRKYEGGSKGKRTKFWFTRGSDANSEIAKDLRTLRNRARDLRRNNAYAKRAIEVTTNNVVGKGIQTRVIGNNSDGLQAKWKKWAGSKKIDFDERHNIFGLQRLIMDAIQESGEVLVRRRYIKDDKFPLQYQVLEADFLTDQKDHENLESGGRIIQGVEFNKEGKRVAYHLYESHPGDSKTTLKTKINRIKAKDIMHLFRQERPGQVRGVPWSSSVIIRLKDLDDFQDAQLMRQKIAALFTAFVHDISAEVDCKEDSSDGDFGENLEPGIIEELPPGKTITFANPPPVQNYKEFTSVELHSIATGLGISYESLVGDLSEINFSSARLGWLEMNRNIEVWRSGILIPDFIAPVFEDFLIMMKTMGEIISEETSATHIPPKREMIDPTKEVSASIKKIRAGLSSLSAEISAGGEDPDEVLNQIEKDQIKTNDKNILLDSNVKDTNSDGSIQEGKTDEKIQNKNS